MQPLVLILIMVNFAAVSTLTTLSIKSIKSQSVRYTADWTSLDSRPLPAWYTEAKFGIFLHWSVFSVTDLGEPNFEQLLSQKSKREVEYLANNFSPGTTYTDLCRLFSAKYYNASEWVDLFEKAGAKYVVLTSKHLEGFCNWNTKHSERWNSVQCGPKRDLLGELETAVRKSGKMKFGVYHGMMDVLNSIWREDLANHLKTNTFVETKTTPQLHEIINNYKPDLLWSDADYDAPWQYWNATNFLAWLYNDSPVKDNIVVNDRWGQGTHCKHGGFMTCTDNYNPKVLQKRYFECCSKSGGNWGYSKHDDIDDIISPTQVITKLVQVVSCGGNLLLNIAPTFDGFIMPVFQHLLKEIGLFMDAYGEAIYGTSPWKVQNDPVSKNVWYTQQKSSNGSTIYACITDNWPADILELGAPKPTMFAIVTLLGDSTYLKWSYNQSLRIAMPRIGPDYPLKHGWVLKLQNIF